jgi:hypothetical protein
MVSRQSTAEVFEFVIPTGCTNSECCAVDNRLDFDGLTSAYKFAAMEVSANLHSKK